MNVNWSQKWREKNRLINFPSPLKPFPRVKPIVLACFLFFTFILIYNDCLFAQPEFRVNPHYVENDIRGMFAVRDTLIVRNNGDARLQWAVEIRLQGNPADTAWITLSRTNGQIDPGGWQGVVVTMRGRNLADGHYFADLYFTSNDPHRAEWTVPCAGHKAPYPRIEAVWQVPQQGEWWGIDMNRILGTLYWGQNYTFDLTIRNRGSDTLRVDTIACQNAYFRITPSQFTLAPNSNRQVTVRLEAQELGANSTIVTSQSNVWDPAELNFRIVATVSPVFRLGSPIPDITIDEDSGEHLIADLDTVFISSYPETRISVAGGLGTRWRLHRNNEFYITPIPNWNGVTTYILTATADTLSMADTFQVTVTPLPDPPSPFDLILPEYEDTLWFDRGDSLFVWQSAPDPDGDTVKYRLVVFFSPADSLYWEGLKDTVYSTKELFFREDVQGWVDWTVRAEGGGLWRSAWSTFRLYLESGRQRTAIITDPLPQLAWSLFPNPSNHFTTLRFSTPTSRLISGGIYDLRGSLVFTIDPIYLPSGIHNLPLNLSHLPSGEYILYFKSEGKPLPPTRLILNR